MALDRRRVQTAVIGHAESEDPVVLPMEAIELDNFRERHTGQSYWCGVWLGGCGHQLTTKLYTDRACHFAHVPDPEDTSACGRQAAGVASADHLYIKHGVLEWLAEQDIAATATVARDADGSISGEVLFTPQGHEDLTVVLASASGSVLAGADASQLVLGPGMTHDPHVLVEQGYVNRIQCVPDGTGRRVQVGTQRRDGTRWFDLSECALTPTGLSTPAVEEIRHLRTSRRPIGVRPPRTASTTARPLTAAVDVVAHDMQTSQDRTAVMAALDDAVAAGHSVTEIRRWLNRAEVALHGGATAQENDLMRRAGDLLLRLERGVGAPTPREPNLLERKALKTVERLLRELDLQKDRGIQTITPRQRRQLEQASEQAGAWLTDQQRSKIASVQQARSGPVAVPQNPQNPPRKSAPVPTSRKPAPGPADAGNFDPAGLADAVRDVLEHAARLGKTVTFSSLCAQVKGLAELPEPQQVYVLRRVTPTAASRGPRPQRPALLTALITNEEGTMHPLYRRLADLAGHHLPKQPHSAWADTVNVIHDRYRRR
ncbi:hypothetical protein ACFYY1_35240 [Streptomyces sp. NPDC001890]|uniref:hypothetical protein n=1 Tax=Streptomyces sp. NPDC001890 TaxID=3364620 RepID=UPI0036CB61A2